MFYLKIRDDLVWSSLIIAHFLSLSGDTMEMMQAVLDSNFWLGTHVVMQATGYALALVAGFISTILVVKKWVDVRGYKLLFPKALKSMTAWLYSASPPFYI